MTEVTCSYCGATTDRAAAGPTVFICSVCVESYVEALKRPESPGEAKHSSIICCFCGKTSEEAGRMFTGTDASICDECLYLVNCIVGPEPDSS